MALRTKLIIGVLALAILAVVGRFTIATHFDAATLITWLRDAGSSVAAVPLYVGLFGAATTLVFGPAVLMMIVAGVTWGFWPGWLIVWVSANLWANLHFAFGRWIAGDAIRKWLDQRKVTWLTRELDQGGVFTTIMIRQLPLPFVLVNVSGGASPMPWRRWVIGNAIGLLPNCLIYTQLAAALADGVEGAKHEALVRMLVSATLVIGMTLLTRWLQRRFARSTGDGAAAQREA